MLRSAISKAREPRFGPSLDNSLGGHFHVAQPKAAPTMKVAGPKHIMFPDFFESISSRKDKKLIRETFHDVLEQGRTDNIDADLLEIRTKLTSQHGGEINFYRSPIIDQWRREKKKGKAGEESGATKSSGARPDDQDALTSIDVVDTTRLEDLHELATR